LGTWNDDSTNVEAEGWEDELVDDVIQESKFAIKEKRRQERLSKQQARKSMRAQQKTSGSQTLGTKTFS
jgi:hypothetical protein